MKDGGLWVYRGRRWSLNEIINNGDIRHVMKKIMNWRHGISSMNNRWAAGIISARMSGKTNK